jgi:transcriptional regulator with GAF, ATPase, and Fis domain
MRSAERWLEDRDQIGIGKTILVFRSGQTDVPAKPADPGDTKPVLLAACLLVFLFRALAGGKTDASRRTVQSHIVRLIGDLIPMSSGVVLVGASETELMEEAASGGGRGDVQPSIERLCRDGAFEDAATGRLGVPLYAAGSLVGAIVLSLSETQRASADGHLETLTAIASLASAGFETNQEVEDLRAENALLQEQIASTSGIVGSSPAIQRLLQTIDKVAPHDTTVLITGESGTGKELIARALHQRSTRAGRPFVAVNCAALPETLFESELFGHEKGAFTGAVSQKKGRFERAHGGTIFLDEVGELALPMQPKLLRVLEEREVERVGGSQAYPLDVRIIAATNRDLSEDVRQGRFRRDLYHRLETVTLKSPPLRERKDDIPLLAAYFLRRWAERCKRNVLGLSQEAEQILLQYPWPGNVRELENAMERAVVLGVSDRVLPEDLPEAVLDAVPGEGKPKYYSSVGQAKREAILDAYIQGGGDYKQAARVLGIHPNYLLRLVKNLGLREDINRALAASG